ncbi:MAG: hypothetical protein FJ009_06210 [Chloroflexi bacterium]|nr:hypothetical protein [Chloroflexota bacterium]
MKGDVRDEKIIVHPTFHRQHKIVFGTAAIQGVVEIDGTVYTFYHTVSLVLKPVPKPKEEEEKAE